MSTRLWTDTARDYLSTYWWLAILRGIVAILFGIAAAGPTRFVVGPFVVAVRRVCPGQRSPCDDLFHQPGHPPQEMVGNVHRRDHRRGRGLDHVLHARADRVVGVILVAIWAILIGVFQFIAAITRFGPAAHGWLMAIAGLLSVVLGILLFVYPGVGLLLIIWFLGIYGLAFGSTRSYWDSISGIWTNGYRACTPRAHRAANAVKGAVSTLTHGLYVLLSTLEL